MRRAPDPRRLRVHTWNMGGCSSDAYDVLCEWLERQQDLEVLLLQETHWGLGRTESQWSTMGWTWFSSPDPARRYAGVAIVVSKRLAPSTACTFCEWVPGRVLQLNIDLVTVYQWVREASYSAERQEQRTQEDLRWHQLHRTERFAAFQMQVQHVAENASPTGNVLTPREQFDAIYQYFSTVFQRQDAFQHSTLHTAVAFSAAEVEQAAGTPSDLCEMVMDLHEQCRYSIRHNRHTGQLPMQLGVRQGCSLSPLLFAIFTGFFYEALQARTDAKWAAAFVTLFADDTMLQWHIESEARHRIKDGYVLGLGTPTQNMEQGDQEMAEQARREAAEVFGAPPLKNRGQVAPRDDGRAGGLGGKKAQVERTCFQRPTELRQRKLQWLLERSQGSVDIRASAAWGAGAGVSSQCGEDVDAARVGDAAASSRHDVDDVRGYTRARSALIQEKSAKWQELYQEKKVTSSLRTVLLIGVFQELATRLQALLQDQDRLTKMHSVGWLVNGEQALNPKWIYQQRSPEKQTVEVSPQAPIPYSLALDAIQAVINNVGGSWRYKFTRGQQSTLAKALQDSYTGLSFADWKPQSQWTQEGQAMEGGGWREVTRQHDVCQFMQWHPGERIAVPVFSLPPPVDGDVEQGSPANQVMAMSRMAADASQPHAWTEAPAATAQSPSRKAVTDAEDGELSGEVLGAKSA
ncbi:hypothetical protein AK812_SmicGene40178 [Symbiodinium microadriaticum]|uniref:Uncharacterized protein n=1 Tax=Symbiodinium microadriaticum TaxID=2951 RepID=A0A1Q9C9C2_SYMMI|nr:hypothetical protein AK812_SmicGene40178 [Symbiodinium microadriaticum]